MLAEGKLLSAVSNTPPTMSSHFFCRTRQDKQWAGLDELWQGEATLHLAAVLKPELDDSVSHVQLWPPSGLNV